MTPAARRPRSPILSVVLAVSGLGLAGPASAVAIYPDGFDDASLSQWLGQETDLRPAQVVAISRGSVAGIIAGPEMRDGVAWVTVRLEATAPPAPLPNDVEILSSQVEVAVDCDHRLIRQGASTGHPGRNLAGTGYIIAEQDGDWKFPTVGTQLDAVWRAVCDPAFVRPLAPRPVPAAVRPHPAGRQTQIAQAGRAKPPAPANAKPAPAPAKPPAPAAAKPPAPPPTGPIETTAAPPAPPASAVAPPPAPSAAKPLDLAAAPPPAAEPVPESATVEAPPPAPAADKPVEPAATPAPAAAPGAAPAPEAAQPPAPPPGLKAATAEPQPSEAAPAGVPEAPGPPKDAPAKTGAQGLNFALRVRLGAFSDEGEATQALQRLLARNMSVLNGRAAFVGPAQDGHGFAIELAGFEDAEAAQAACSVLSISDGPCAIAPPASGAARPDRGTVTRTGAKAAKPARRPGG